MLNIKFELNLEDTEKKLLARILEKETEQPEQLEEALKDYASAALEEYYRMMLGQKIFGRIQDIKEYRLFLLIKHVFKGGLPGERQIAALFQTTGSASRSLLRNTVAKYRHEMDETILNLVKEKIKEAKKDADGKFYRFSADTAIIMDEMNTLLLKQKDKTNPPVAKEKDTVSSYIIKNSSYDALVKLLETE